MRPSAPERAGNTFNACKDFRTENGSSQDQNLAVAGLFVPSSLDSGLHVCLQWEGRLPYRPAALPPYRGMWVCLFVWARQPVGVGVMVSTNNKGAGSQPYDEWHFHVTRLNTRVLMTCAVMPRPESGLDCLMCAEFPRSQN